MTELAQNFVIAGQTPEALAKVLMDEMLEGKVQGKQSDYDFMKRVIAAGADLTLHGRYDRNPLQLASGLRYSSLVTELITAKAPLDAQSDKDGQTALHIAAHVGDGSIVQKLLDAGASPDIPDKEGKTPLDIARLDGSSQMAIEAIEKALSQKAEAEAAKAKAAAAEQAVIKAATDQYLESGMPLQQTITVPRQLKLRQT
jgi:ankyrin repeat protein